MTTLVTYSSQTGNTKKVAEAIFAAIEGEKEIRPIEYAPGLDGYDLAFVGFPIVRFGIGPDVKQFLAEHAAGKRIALFVTHAATEDQPEVEDWIAAATEAAAGAEIVGVFHCQGALAPQVKAFMLGMDDPQMRAWAEGDNSQGQPDAARLARAREFAAGVAGGHARP